LTLSSVRFVHERHALREVRAVRFNPMNGHLQPDDPLLRARHDLETRIEVGGKEEWFIALDAIACQTPSRAVRQCRSANSLTNGGVLLLAPSGLSHGYPRRHSAGATTTVNVMASLLRLPLRRESLGSQPS
jgi:hypothetical protein